MLQNNILRQCLSIVHKIKKNIQIIVYNLKYIYIKNSLYIY